MAADKLYKVQNIIQVQGSDFNAAKARNNELKNIDLVTDNQGRQAIEIVDDKNGKKYYMRMNSKKEMQLGKSIDNKNIERYLGAFLTSDLNEDINQAQLMTPDEQDNMRQLAADGVMALIDEGLVDEKLIEKAAGAASFLNTSYLVKKGLDFAYSNSTEEILDAQKKDRFTGTAITAQEGEKYGVILDKNDVDTVYYVGLGVNNKGVYVGDKNGSLETAQKVEDFQQLDVFKNHDKEVRPALLQAMHAGVLGMENDSVRLAALEKANQSPQQFAQNESNTITQNQPLSSQPHGLATLRSSGAPVNQGASNDVALNVQQGGHEQ